MAVDLSPIREALARAIAEGRQAGGPLAFGEVPGTPAQARLAEILEDCPDLELFRAGLYQYEVGSWGMVNHTIVAGWLMLRGDRVGVAQAVADLERYVQNNLIDYQSFSVVTGIKLEEPVDLGNGFRVEPYDPSVAGAWDRLFDWTRHGGGGGLYQPRALLILARKYEKAHRPEASTGEYPDLQRDQQEMDDMTLLLGLASRCPIMPLGSWKRPAEWVPGTFGETASSPTPTQWGGIVRDCRANPARAQHLIGHWIGLPSPQRDTLRVALTWIERARRLERQVDRAIAIGVAFESMFLSDDERGELRFRLALRAARFLETELNARKQTSAKIKHLYDLRSIAVHTGRLSEVKNKVNTETALLEGLELASKACERLIAEGFPDWSVLELDAI